MESTFKYSVLKYQPSYFLEERVNIGLLFIFFDINKVKFLYPKKLQRLSYLHQSVDISEIKSYLKRFEQKAETLSENNLFINNFNNLIEENFLVKDSNSLFFSDLKTGKHSDSIKVIDYYKKEYLGIYDDVLIEKKDHDKNLIRKFSELIDDEPCQKKHFFRKKYLLKNERVETYFDYAWQNGTTNLVKSLSFNLKSKEGIQNKAFRWYGELNQFKEQAEKENIKFDIIVGRPDNNNFYPIYDKALKILDDIESNKQIVEEAEIKEYAFKALRTVKPLRSSK